MWIILAQGESFGLFQHPQAHMFFSFQCLFFHEVEFTDKWNLHPWDAGSCSTELKRSLLQTGILHPPFLLQQADSGFEVISGHRRLLIARQQLESEQVGCFVLPEASPVPRILEILLADQSNTAPLSLAEKARFIQIAAKFLSREEILAQFLEKLGLRKQISTIDEMLALLTMQNDIIKEIHNGRLQDKMVKELQRIKNPEDRLALVNLFKDLVLGTGKQRKLFSLIRDLTCRNNTSISDFLNSDEVLQILNHKEMNPPQKTQHLNVFLQKQLNPGYLEAENSFTTFSKELKLPENFTLSHSQAFETDEIELSLRFKNRQECRQLLPKIKTVFKK